MDSELRDRPRWHQAEAPIPANPGNRGRAAAALISVCLGFFVIQLDAWSAAVNVYWEVNEGGGEDEHTGTAARRSKVHRCG